MPVVDYTWNCLTNNVLEELRSGGDVVASYWHEPALFGMAVGMTRSGEHYYYHSDAIGSTRLVSDSAGEVANQYNYDAWGTTLFQSESTLNDNRWCGGFGYWRDNEVASYYVRARTYSADQGRWTSVDPQWHPAAYLYAMNAPLNNVDPTGEVTVTAALGFIRLAGILYSFYTGASAYSKLVQATLADIFGKTDVEALSGNSWEGVPEGKSANIRKCPEGKLEQMPMAEFGWWNILGGERKLKLLLNANWSGGSVSGDVAYSASGSNGYSGIVVNSITLRGSKKGYECECYKYIPCLNGTVQVRLVGERDYWYDYDKTFPVTFFVCADGTKGGKVGDA